MHKPDSIVNFQGVTCPYNYVKTKLALEEMAPGQILEVIVDDGEPSRNVPRSITQDGQTVVNTYTDNDGLVHILIRKTADI